MESAFETQHRRDKTVPAEGGHGWVFFKKCPEKFSKTAMEAPDFTNSRLTKQRAKARPFSQRSRTIAQGRFQEASNREFSEKTGTTQPGEKRFRKGTGRMRCGFSTSPFQRVFRKSRPDSTEKTTEKDVWNGFFERHVLKKRSPLPQRVPDEFSSSFYQSVVLIFSKPARTFYSESAGERRKPIGRLPGLPKYRNLWLNGLRRRGACR